jgi:hypothetical protein
MAIISRSAAKDWRAVVTEPNAREVFEALADPTWDFRTIDGLAQSTALPQNLIKQILSKYGPFVRQSPVLDRRGRELYTLASRGSTFRELLSTARAFISKTTST